MGVILNHESEYAKELLKFEQHRTKFVGEDQEPGNPYVFRPYPKMLYKAQADAGGRVICLMTPPHPHAFKDAQGYEQAVLHAESFNQRCTLIVKDLRDHERAMDQGWCESPQLALAKAEALAQDVATAAAEAAHSVRRMSEQARAEYAQVETETHAHVVDVVPQRKRGRPARGVSAVTGA